MLGRTAPLRLTDGRTPSYRDWSEGYDPETWLDRAIHATRSEIFPWHGLDPLPEIPQHGENQADTPWFRQFL